MIFFGSLSNHAVADEEVEGNDDDDDVVKIAS